MEKSIKKLKLIGKIHKYLLVNGPQPTSRIKRTFIGYVDEHDRTYMRKLLHYAEDIGVLRIKGRAAVIDGYYVGGDDEIIWEIVCKNSSAAILKRMIQLKSNKAVRINKLIQSKREGGSSL